MFRLYLPCLCSIPPIEMVVHPIEQVRFQEYKIAHDCIQRVLIGLVPMHDSTNCEVNEWDISDAADCRFKGSLNQFIIVGAFGAELLLSEQRGQVIAVSEGQEENERKNH